MTPEPPQHNPTPPPASEPVTAADWQRLAARRAFQGDLDGAIIAMEQAVTVDPDSFHHWMWLGKLYRQANSDAEAQRCAREGLRCLDENPSSIISPEEKTRLMVRTGLQAGERHRAQSALMQLEALRRTRLDQCVEAQTFEEWQSAMNQAAVTFETLLELWRIMDDFDQVSSVIGRYAGAFDAGVELGARERRGDDTLKEYQERAARIRRQSDAGTAAE